VSLLTVCASCGHRWRTHRFLGQRKVSRHASMVGLACVQMGCECRIPLPTRYVRVERVDSPEAPPIGIHEGKLSALSREYPTWSVGGVTP
jgi:hypothetical protein